MKCVLQGYNNLTSHCDLALLMYCSMAPIVFINCRKLSKVTQKILPAWLLAKWIENCKSLREVLIYFGWVIRLQICWPLTVTWQSQILMRCWEDSNKFFLAFKYFWWDRWNEENISSLSDNLFKSVSDFEHFFNPIDRWVLFPERIFNCM